MYVLAVEYYDERKTVVYKACDGYFDREFSKTWGVSLIEKLHGLVLSEVPISTSEFNQFKDIRRATTVPAHPNKFPQSCISAQTHTRYPLRLYVPFLRGTPLLYPAAIRLSQPLY